jgi:hypothetical protein
MEPELERRVGENEAVLRDVNEGIKRGQWPGEEDAQIAFRCECARLGCNKLVELTAREYERVRAHPRRFFVAPGHQFPQAETVVAAERGYVIVEKLGEAGDRADKSDPRP